MAPMNPYIQQAFGRFRYDENYHPISSLYVCMYMFHTVCMYVVSLLCVYNLH